MTARILSLCSGYLGLDMAVESVLDARTVAVSDIDPGAKRILTHRAPDVPNLGDVKAIHWEDWAGVEIMTAGYPCQPFSHAGKRGGVDDPRHIFPYIADGIRRVGPRLVFLENVRGHLRLGFDVVLGALADIGYDAQWVCVRASDVGACHKRERLFIVATPADSERGGWDWRTHEPVGRSEGRAVAARGGEDAWRGLTLLPTPRTSDTNGSGSHGDGGLDLRTVVDLLPTPRAARGGSGTETMYAFGAERSDTNRPQGEVLLPTPRNADAGPRGGTTGYGLRDWSRGMRPLLPTPRATDGTKGGPNQRGSSGDLMMPSAVFQEWSIYGSAIRRHEAAFGRPAPSPTETGPKGGQRLSPRFVEWMMMLPDGHVTDPDIGLSRNEQLKALGNGVVPSQAAAALRFMLARTSEVAA